MLWTYSELSQENVDICPIYVEKIRIPYAPNVELGQHLRKTSPITPQLRTQFRRNSKFAVYCAFYCLKIVKFTN